MAKNKASAKSHSSKTIKKLLDEITPEEQAATEKKMMMKIIQHRLVVVHKETCGHDDFRVRATGEAGTIEFKFKNDFYYRELQQGDWFELNMKRVTEHK